MVQCSTGDNPLVNVNERGAAFSASSIKLIVA
jgi:hypothetical protein